MMTLHRPNNPSCPNDPGPARNLILRIAWTIREARARLRLTQRAVADRAGVSQSTVSRLERGIARSFDLDRVQGVLAALGVRAELLLSAPAVLAAPIQRDAAHARLMAYVERRLRRLGWTIRRELPVGGDRVRGWIDMLAWDDASRILVVIEIKTSLSDLGDLERQIGWYERAAWAVARSLGWQPRRVIVLLAAAANEGNAVFVRANRAALQARFPMAPSEFERLIRGRAPGSAGPGRCLAFVDPARRRTHFLLPSGLWHGTRVDGGSAGKAH